MEFSKETQGDILIVTVNLFRATMKEAESFKHNLVSEIEQGWKKIIVDLSYSEFIDSTFLGALVLSLKKVTSAGGDLRLVGFQPSVHSMFELTRMYRVFESFKTQEEAIKSFS